MNVKIDYASINDDDAPLKLHPKRDDVDDDEEDDTIDADSNSETSDNDAIDDDEVNETENNTDSDTSDDESIKDGVEDDNDENNDDDDDDDKENGNNGNNSDESGGSDNDEDEDHDIDSSDDVNDETLGDAEDDDDDAEESRYRKINQDFRRNYITETHPETSTHTEDEIHALAKVVRNKLGTIVDPLHRTVPILTKYEKTRVLGIRTKQLNNGAEPFISSKINITPDKIIDGYPIALKELEEKKLPFIIRRPLPGGGVEYWYLQDLEVLS
jgi:DNA-directed RNA polymerase subunit K/omega